MTWQRPAGRLTSKLLPSHRYRCQSPACQWEGNRRVRPAIGTTAAQGPRTPAHRRWLAEAGTVLLAFASAAFIDTGGDTRQTASHFIATASPSPAGSLHAATEPAGTRTARTGAVVGSRTHRPADERP